MENKFLTVGYIVKTRGLKGVLKVKSSSSFSELRYQKGNTLYLYNPKDNTRIKVEVLSYSNEGEFDYVCFKNYEDINLVEKFISWQVQVNRDEIPPLEEGEYYYCDLEGLNCLDISTNKVFGVVLKIEDFTAQPSFRIALDNHKTILIPFVDAFVKSIDLDNKTIVFKLIDGMLD